MENKNIAFFTGIKHCIQYDTWEQFIQNEEGVKRIWNDFSLFSWSLHPTHKNTLQLSWVALEHFKGDLPTFSPIKRLQSYLEIRTIEIKFLPENQSSIQKWLILNTPSFWSNPSSFSAC